MWTLKRADLGTTRWQPDPDPSASSGESETCEKAPKNVHVISFRVRGNLAFRYRVHSQIMADIYPSYSLQRRKWRPVRCGQIRGH